MLQSVLKVCIALLFISSPITAQTLSVPDGFHGGAEIATGNFLIAKQFMRDPRFRESVIFLVQHNEKGTVGLVINQATQSNVKDFFPEFAGLSKFGELLFYGGPVSVKQVFFLLRDKHQPKDTLHVLEDVHVTSNVKAVKTWLGGKKAKDNLRVFLGYAGWLPNQLAAEVVEGSWNVMKADSKTIFEKAPNELWPELDNRTTLRQTQLPVCSDDFSRHM